MANIVHELVAYDIYDKSPDSTIMTLLQDGSVQEWKGVRYNRSFLLLPHQEEPERNVEELVRLRQVYNEYWEQGLLCYPDFAIAGKKYYVFSLEWWDEYMYKDPFPPLPSEPIGNLFLGWLDRVRSGRAPRSSFYLNPKFTQLASIATKNQ